MDRAEQNSQVASAGKAATKAAQTGLKIPTVAQMTTTAVQTGLKNPMVEQMTTTAMQTELKTLWADQTCQDRQETQELMCAQPTHIKWVWPQRPVLQFLKAQVWLPSRLRVLELTHGLTQSDSPAAGSIHGRVLCHSDLRLAGKIQVQLYCEIQKINAIQPGMSQDIIQNNEKTRKQKPENKNKKTKTRPSARMCSAADLCNDEVQVAVISILVIECVVIGGRWSLTCL
ncbi:hypothetical protein DPX16_19908 [Anabarilius grahami]|uniref:Uncharacterized protein n=1 Tax=Anabarilius grahami TaxID=495550 RepID=A0A3N0YGN6_ANAGA|nr:hypothetical protein DPX16_19908 [Anabarilius grahami]